MKNRKLEVIDWLLANEMIYRGRTQLPISSELDSIKHFLQRLDEIDNASPTKALKALERIVDNFPTEELSEVVGYTQDDAAKDWCLILEALVKSKEVEKAFQALKELLLLEIREIGGRYYIKYRNIEEDNYIDYEISKELYEVLK